MAVVADALVRDSFFSLILKGGYSEDVTYVVFLGTEQERFERTAGTVAFRRAEHYHKITLHGGRPVWTLVVTGPRRNEPWGYCTEDGRIDHITYRRLKHASDA
jgi:hypothetical protein